ncbi:hypothetical protein B0T11DRAFT_79867 [Plectosphaerella cucumerina]|uniref:Uncharacterized protein n=1 Tax=Plectosphaerella cucumerina TaxID=40658 RepID=A0A8K0X2W4_9PEZI|nr:hypothetical protein B0T11DRAFT_79867 [Plectosphaerella cucumerina]
MAQMAWRARGGGTTSSSVLPKQRVWEQREGRIWDHLKNPAFTIVSEEFLRRMHCARPPPADTLATAISGLGALPRHRPALVRNVGQRDADASRGREDRNARVSSRRAVWFENRRRRSQLAYGHESRRGKMRPRSLRTEWLAVCLPMASHPGRLDFTCPLIWRSMIADGYQRNIQERWHDCWFHPRPASPSLAGHRGRASASVPAQIVTPRCDGARRRRGVSFSLPCSTVFHPFCLLSPHSRTKEGSQDFGTHAHRRATARNCSALLETFDGGVLNLFLNVRPSGGSAKTTCPLSLPACDNHEGREERDG